MDIAYWFFKGWHSQNRLLLIYWREFCFFVLFCFLSSSKFSTLLLQQTVHDHLLSAQCQDIWRCVWPRPFPPEALGFKVETNTQLSVAVAGLAWRKSKGIKDCVGSRVGVEGRKSFTGRRISRRSLEGEKDSSNRQGQGRPSRQRETQKCHIYGHLIYNKALWRSSREEIVSIIIAGSMGYSNGEKMNFGLYHPPYTELNLW